MKKSISSIAIMAVAICMASCGNKSEFTTYNNEKHGYSVDVPSWMTRKDPTIGNDGDGTIFLSNPKDMWDINRIDIGGGSDGNWMGEEWTPENVKKKYESEIEEYNDLIEHECGDNYYSYVRKDQEDEYFTRYKRVFKGKKDARVTISHYADKEDKLGGDVAKHIFNSLTIK